MIGKPASDLDVPHMCVPVVGASARGRILVR
jgi:hypothetical protein